MVRQGERGGSRADAEGGDGDGREGESRRAAQAAGGPGEVPAQDVPVRGNGAGENIGDRVEPEEQNGERVGRLLETERK